MIRVVNLTKKFFTTTALDNISFEVARGEVVGLLGPNGAGKTTTMRILTCFLPPTEGEVEVGGMDARQHSLDVRRLIGYLPENNPLYPEMRVVEYLEFRAALKKVSRRLRAARLKDVLEKCQLVDERRRVIGTLSKGTRQRVGLAEALIHDPQLLILDEPTLGLDPNQVRQVRALIRELGRDRTILLSTHILPEVEAVCSRAIILNQGKIAASGTPRDLVEKTPGARTLEDVFVNLTAAEELSV